MLNFNLKEYDEGADDVLGEINRMKKTDTIAIKDIDLNPLNPELDDPQEIKDFADKIYHSKNGVLESITVYRNDNGRYTLLSGHKRFKACKYNIEHENELDGSGEVQRVLFANIINKPISTEEEMNLILDFNDYRRLETFEKKYKLFLPYYQIVAVMTKENRFRGRIREYISKRSGLGLKCVGDCINELKNTVLTTLLEFKEELENNTVQLEDKNEYLMKKTNLPYETLQLIQQKIKSGIERQEQTTLEDFNVNVKEENKRNIQLNAVSEELTDFFDCKCTVDKNNKITIKCCGDEHLNEVLMKMGVINDDI